MQLKELKPFAKAYWAQIKPWWVSEEKKIAWVGLISLISISCLAVYMGVLFNEWSKYFYESLENKNYAAFKHQLLIFVPLAIVTITEFCLRNYLSAWLSFRWRKWMTTRLVTEWLSNKNYYKISNFSSFDNPDQRIAEDVYTICYYTISLFLTFFRDGINFITFSVILWGLSNQLEFSIAGKLIQIPGLLLWLAILYSLFGIAFTFKVGAPLINLDRAQEKCEANFRYRLMRISERKEEIGTFSGEHFENSRLEESFTVITQNYYQILKRNIYINIFQNFYINVGAFLPLFIVAPLYFVSVTTTALTIGVLMQVRGMFIQVNESLTSVAASFTTVASLVAASQRMIDFRAHMITLEENPLNSTPQDKISHLHISKRVLTARDGRPLCEVPDIILQAGDRKLLMGPSGSGKTSLLRTLVGLQPIDSPAPISVPNGMMFIPQRPYMPLGTLRQCLSYPSEGFSEKRLKAIMQVCHLEHLIEALDEIRDWHQILSLGEQQRVNFARVLLHRPKWLMMDEPTSQLNVEYAEELCSVLVKDLADTGILIITHQKLPYFKEIIKVKSAIPVPLV
jgi:putative ATP-binding cassette transporter